MEQPRQDSQPDSRTPHRMPPGHPTPVRVLLRGLELIQALNRYGPMSTAAISQPSVDRARIPAQSASNPTPNPFQTIITGPDRSSQ